MLDFNKPITTRDGLEVRIYARDGSYNQIHGAVKCDTGWVAVVWTADGTSHTSANSWSLINPPQRFSREVWVNVYPLNFCNGMSFYPTKQQADRYATKARIGCIKFLIEGSAGEGL